MQHVDVVLSEALFSFSFANEAAAATAAAVALESSYKSSSLPLFFSCIVRLEANLSVDCSLLQ